MRIVGPQSLQDPENLEFLVTGAQLRRCRTAVCVHGHRVWGSFPLPSRSSPTSLPPFSSFPYSKINQGCNAAGAVQILPSGAISVWDRASDQKQTRFLQLQNSLSLNDSVYGCLKVETMNMLLVLSEVGTGGVKYRANQQFAAAERFNIVTLTMYLIDISFL